ncbi:MAG: DNA topoisomerase, partial [Lachnospiraceae bacterium]|nr:DNA topoisomerase [Lachnospiraceae bacterium]
AAPRLHQARAVRSAANAAKDIRACNIIDLIIEILRGSKNLKQAKECLINGDVSDIKFKSEASRKAAMKLDFTPRQATAVLELRLYKLIGLEIEALQKEYEETLNKIAEYEDVLNNRSTMKKVIKKDIQKIKKEYQVPRKTIIEDGKEAVYEEVKLVEQEVVFIMDRFGYAKTVDNNTFERNKEAIFNENKYVFKCMNTEKICIFTDKGDLHQVKVADIPFGRFRDKGTPIDNLGNYDSRGENIIYLCSTGQIIERKLLFATKMGMIKLVDGKEFDVTKRTVAATKLNDGDEVINVLPTDAVVSVDSQGQEIISSEEHLVIKTEGGYYLKFAISEIPQKKKGAVGVRGIKLVSGDSVSDLYLFNKESEIVVGYGKKQISLKDDINLTKRDGRGVKK